MMVYNNPIEFIFSSIRYIYTNTKRKVQAGLLPTIL
jgi:hypothetical protein